MTDQVEVKLTDDGPMRIRGNGRTWERGETRQVDVDHADRLVESADYFEIVGRDEPADEAGDDGSTEGLEDLTKDELYDLATEEDVDGRSQMDKGELIDALQEA